MSRLIEFVFNGGVVQKIEVEGFNFFPLVEREVVRLLNEHEATLPVETDNFPFYEWEKVKAFYLNLLDNSPIKDKFN